MPRGRISNGSTGWVGSHAFSVRVGPVDPRFGHRPMCSGYATIAARPGPETVRPGPGGLGPGRLDREDTGSVGGGYGAAMKIWA